MRPLGMLALVLPLALSTTACGTRTTPGPRGPNATQGPLAVAAVSDAEFGQSAYQVLLTEEPTPERTGLLAGVVQRQLARAAHRFAGDRREAGLAALTGGLYLLRVGELRPEMLQGGSPALRAGAGEVSRLGNEGRAQALYGMLRTVLPPGKERDDVDAHLRALASWSSASTVAGPMQAAGALQRAATQRALFEPSQKALDAARDSSIAWIKKGLDFSSSEVTAGPGFDREEAIEAYRSVRAGGATLVAIYLRYGDAQGALDALDKGDLLRVVPPGLVERLERAAENDDPGAWADLYRLYAESDDEDRPETSLDAELARAAAWGTAVELFRAEPRSLRGAGPLALQLVAYGMGEVAPLVLAPALGERPSAQDLSWTLALVLRGVLGEDEIGEHVAARRTFAAAKPILDLAESSQLVGKVRPSPARLHYVMGALETRAGDLARARPHVEAAAKQEPSVEVWTMLAAIDRQRGAAKSALDALDRVVSRARKHGDALSEAEALLTQFEIFRDQRQNAEAKGALSSALSRVLAAREAARTSSDQARSERLLARVLEHYGATQDARRATERAYDASRADARQVAATLLDASRRALTLGDLVGARRVMRQALDARLDDEDLVYVALWLRLLERKPGSDSDGSADEALALIGDDSRWPAQLAAWGRGKINDDQLQRAARTRVERTEAKFYVAMSRMMSGGDGKQALREVAGSEAIELVEVTIARDLLSRETPLELTLPSDVTLP